jgi:hypothetical protein
MMERSAPLPVRVDIRISTLSTDGLHPLAASELLFAASRIRALRLVGLRADILPVLDRLRSPSPLEALTLSIYDSGPPVELPETLFGNKAPHLRRLTFAADTCIRAPLWLLKSITDFTTGADIALPELLDALRAMPQLQVLRVQHCRAVWDEDNTATTAGSGLAAPRPVPLPHLQLVAFRDTTPRRFVLLAPHIDAPPTVRRHLFWRAWAVPSWERWEGLLRAMRALVPRDSVPGADDGGLRAARLVGGPARGAFSAWTRSASAAAPEREDDALFLFHIDWRGSPVDPRGETLLEHSSPFFHLAGLCAQLGTLRVGELVVEPGPEPDAVGQEQERVVAGDAAGYYWESVLGALRNVQSLRLHGGPASLLFRAVSAANSLLPNLQKIFVVQCDIRCAAGPPPEGVVLWNLKRLALRGGSLDPAGTDDAAASVGNELVALVRRRGGLEVVLIGCGADARALDQLRKYSQVSIGDEWVYI